jgi:signal peptidase II
MINLKYSLFILVGFFFDQCTKFLAESFLGTSKIVHNYGAAYGILQHQKVFLLSVSIGVLFFCFLFQKKIANTFYSRVGLSFFIVGVLGNLVDRLVRGYVIDFIDIRVFPVFNFADISINIAILFFVLDIFLITKNAKKNN